MDGYGALVALVLLDKAQILEGEFVRIQPFLQTAPYVRV
jgi:hypothetical protein